MPKKRADGRLIKDLDPFDRIIPYIMKTRTDSMLMYEDYFECGPMDDYIKAKKAEGFHMTYMNIMIAATVRLLALRPRLNRFVMNGRLYARDNVWVSFAIHRSLDDDDVETTLKLCFTGMESILEISQRIDEAIANEMHNKEAGSDTDKIARTVMKAPGFLIRTVVNFLMWTDKHNMLPKAVLEGSPFHTSFFITNLKSLGINHIFHHVYNFGTTGMFLAIGKEKNIPLLRNGEYQPVKCMGFGMVADERYCDGLYFAKSLRMMRKLMKDPARLETPLGAKVPDSN